MAAIAFSNYLHYAVAEDGLLVVADGAPPEAALAIARTKHKRLVKEDETVVTETEYKLWDKVAALNLLGKKLKLWVEKVEVDDPQAAAYRELLNQLKQQREGGQK